MADKTEPAEFTAMLSQLDPDQLEYTAEIMASIGAGMDAEGEQPTGGVFRAIAGLSLAVREVKIREGMTASARAARLKDEQAKQQL